MIQIIVSDGFDLGRALTFTDLDPMYKEDECTKYALYYARVLVNDPANWNNGGLINSPVMPTNPSIVNQDKENSILSPREANNKACQQIYESLKRNEVDEDPLDFTINYMEYLYWTGESSDNLKKVYPYLYQGSKFGKFLYDSNESEEICTQ